MVDLHYEKNVDGIWIECDAPIDYDEDWLTSLFYDCRQSSPEFDVRGEKYRVVFHSAIVSKWRSRLVR